MRKLLLLATMLAMVLVVASPALAQDDGNEANQVCQAANVNLQYQSTGDVNQTINQNCINNAGNIDVEGDVGGKKFVADGGKKLWVKDFVVDGGKKFVSVGTSFVKDTKVPVFVDHKGAFFTWVKGEVVVLEKDAVTFFPTVVKKDVAAVQYQYAGPAQYQYAKGVAPLKIAVLPDTGGASLITLGAGALLVAGGLLAARRIVR